MADRRMPDGKESHAALRLAVPVALVVVTVAVVLYASRENDRAAAAALETATDQLASCLFDDPSRILVAGSREPIEAAAVRASEVFRAEELTALGLSPERRLASPDVPWPARCALYGHALASVEQRSGNHPRAQATEDLTVAFERSESTRSLGGVLEPLFAAWLEGLRASGRVMARIAEVPAPPRPVHVDTLDTLDRKAILVPASTTPVPLDRLRFAPFTDEDTRFVVDDIGRPGRLALCSYARGRARCVPRVGSATDALVPATAFSLKGVIAGVAEDAKTEWCSSQGVLTSRKRGWDVEAISFLREGTWSTPVDLDAPGGGGAMTCVGARVTLLEQRGHLEAGRYEPVIRESQCTPEGCVTRGVQTRELFANDEAVIPGAARDLDVAAVDDRVILVWRTGDAGLRMRLAKAPDLVKTDDQVLYDDRLAAGRWRASTLVEFRAHPVADGALLLLGTTEGLFLYRVDLSGRFTSVPVD